MQTNHFGDLIPATQAEMVEVFEKKDADPGNCYAQIDPPSDSEELPHFKGWTAMVLSQDGDDIFSTCGFPTKEAITQALTGAGIAEEDLEFLG
jgi:hypothetical protein